MHHSAHDCTRGNFFGPSNSNAYFSRHGSSYLKDFFIKYSGSKDYDSLGVHDGVGAALQPLGGLVHADGHAVPPGRGGKGRDTTGVRKQAGTDNPAPSNPVISKIILNEITRGSRVLSFGIILEIPGWFANYMVALQGIS